MNKESFERYIEKYGDKIINGKEISDFIKFELKRKIQAEEIEKSISTILIGDNENSKIYINLKNKFATGIGVTFNKYFISEEEDEDIIIDSIKFLN